MQVGLRVSSRIMQGGKRKQNNSPVLGSGGSVGTEERSRLSKLKGRLSPVHGKDPSSRRVHFAEGSSAPSSPLRRASFDEIDAGADADADDDAEVAACLDNALFVEVNAEITAALIATAAADTAAEAAAAAADAAAVAADTATSRQLVADAAVAELEYQEHAAGPTAPPSRIISLIEKPPLPPSHAWTPETLIAADPTPLVVTVIEGTDGEPIEIRFHLPNGFPGRMPAGFASRPPHLAPPPVVNGCTTCRHPRGLKYPRSFSAAAGAAAAAAAAAAASRLDAAKRRAWMLESHGRRSIRSGLAPAAAPRAPRRNLSGLYSQVA